MSSTVLEYSGHNVLRICSCTCASLYFSLQFASLAIADDPKTDLPNLAVLLAAYQQNVSSLDPIEVEYELLWDPPRSRPDSVTEMTLRWVRFGERRMLLSENRSSEGTVKEWAAFDGVRYSSFVQDLSNQARPLRPPVGHIGHSRRDNASALSAYIDPERMMGYKLRSTEMGVGDLLARGEAVVEGWDEVGGHRCVRVSLGQHPRSLVDTSNALKSTVWLDPEFGCLPRRCYTELVDETSGSNPVFVDIRVSNFLPIVRGAAQPSDLWLPAAGAVSYRTSQVHFRVSEVSLDVPEDSEFRPTFPENTQVIETNAAGDRKTWYVGGSKGREFWDQRAIDSVTSSPSVSATDPVAAAVNAATDLQVVATQNPFSNRSARSDSPGVWQIVFLVLGLVLVCGALYRSRRVQ